MKSEVIAIGSESMGGPDEKLGGILMGNLLRLLGERDDLPKYIILWNTGALIAAQDSDHIEFLRALEARGVQIIICKTCVDYFQLEDKIEVGKVDGFKNILDILANHTVMTV